MNEHPSIDARQHGPTNSELQQIAAMLRGLRFGSVNIIVQDGVIVQIDRTERRRLRNREASTEATTT